MCWKTWKKIIGWSWSACMMVFFALVVVGCGDAPPSPVPNTATTGPTTTPVIIMVEVTSTPQAVMSTITLTPEPSTPTTMAVLPTATIAIPAPTEVVFPPPSPAADALTYQGIVQQYQSLPGAQRRDYTESLKGDYVLDWNGWVDVSRKQITTGKWELKLDMDSADPNDSSWDVRIIIPEAQASQFSRGQAVSFSGTITEVSCGSSDCDVDIQDATFNSPSTSPAQASAEVPTTSALPPTVVADTPAPPTSPAPPVPTDTPAPPPPTNTPLGPEASIEVGIRKYARSTELQSVEYNGTSVNIVFKVSDNLFIKTAAQKEVADILRGAAEGAPSNYTQVWIVGMFPLKDAYGNVKDGQVLNLRYDKPTIERINWDGFNWKNIYTIADKAIVHPDLKP